MVIGLVLIGLPIQLALALTMVVVLTLHFSLNRQWVFASDSDYAFHLSGQGVRYLVAAGHLVRRARARYRRPAGVARRP